MAIIDFGKAIGNAVGNAVKTYANEASQEQKQKTAYQVNTERITPKQEEPMTSRKALATINELAKVDQKAATSMYERFKNLQQDQTSMYYNPYANPTNRAVEALARYGIDTSVIDDKFFADNDYLKQYLIYNGTTNTPSSPGKKASTLQKAAYEYYQIWKAEEATRKAETQWEALQQELRTKALLPNRNYSDEEIIAGIDWSKYGELKKMYSGDAGFARPEYNRAIGYSDDNLYAVLWAARNPDFNGTLDQALANSYLGNGNTYQPDENLRAKLTPGDPNFDIYTVGSTMEDMQIYFGMSGFNQKWLDDNKWMLNSQDETQRANYIKVDKAYQTTQEAKEERDKLYSKLDSWLIGATNAEDVMKKVDSLLASGDYNTLLKMDKTLEDGYGILDTTSAVDYSRKDIEKLVQNVCASNAAKPKGISYSESVSQKANGTGTAPVVPQQEKEIIDAKDRELETAGLALDDEDLTPAEKAVKDEAWTVAFDNVMKTIRSCISFEGARRTLASNEADNINNEVSGTLGNFQSVYDYEQRQTDLALMEQEADKLRNELNGKQYAGREIEDKLDTIKIDGRSYTFSLRYDPNQGYYLDWVDDDATESGIDKDQWDTFVNNEEINRRIEAANQEAAAIQAARSTGVTMTEEDQETANRLRDLELRIEDTKLALSTDSAEYDKNKKAFDDSIKNASQTIAVMRALGMDTTKYENAYELMEYMVDFSEYEATVWEAYSPSNVYRTAISEGEDIDQVLNAAKSGNDEIVASLEQARIAKQYIEENNIAVPENYMTNLNRAIAKMERDIEDYEDFTLSQKADFSEMAAKGKEMEEKARAEYNKAHPAGSFGQIKEYGDDLIGKMGPVLYFEMEEYEKDTYYYLIGTGDTERADRYIESLKGTYGVLNTRYTEHLREDTKKMAASGAGGFLLTNVMSVLISPLAAMASLGYAGMSKITGEEINPDSAILALNTIRSSTREQSAEEILHQFGTKKADGSYDETFASKAVQMFYEMVTNRLDSLANGSFFGGLTWESDRFKMLKEFISASPMGFSAAMDTMAEAKRKGASDAQAYMLGLVTFVAETGTEAVSLDNMREAFRIGEEASGDTIREFVKKWLTSAGPSEMLGESANDIIESISDEMIMGELSDHADRVWQYRMAGYGKEESEAMARQDEIISVGRTALMSYLSPGLDVFQTAAGRVDYLRRQTRELQKRGASTSMFQLAREEGAEQRAQREYEESRKDDIGETDYDALEARYGNRSEETTEENVAEGKDSQPAAKNTEASEQEAGAAAPENEQARVPSEQIPQETRTQEQADTEALQDYTMLQNSRNAAPAAQAATLAAVLDNGTGEDMTDMARAAAINVNRVIPGGISGVQDILLGANFSGTDTNAVKAGIRYAALGGEQSASFQLVQSEAFTSATPEQQAVMLAEAGRIDSQNVDLQATVSANILENLKAIETRNLIADGAMANAKKAQETADEVRAEARNADEQLEQKQDETDAAVGQVNAAKETVLRNPGEGENAVKEAVSNVKNAATVENEYQQKADAAHAKQEKAEAAAQQAKQDALTDVRQQADANVNQAMEQRRQEQAAREAQNRIDEEIRAKTEAAARENRNFARLNAEDFVKKNFPNLSKEARDYVVGRVMEIQAEMSNNVDSILARRDFAKAFAKKFGLEWKNVDTSEGGKYSPAFNARVNRRTGVLEVDKSATQSDIMYAILTHEITHLAEQSNTYHELADFALQLRYGDGVTYQGILDLMKSGDVSSRLAQDILEMKERYIGELGEDKGIDNEYALQEVVADSVGYLIAGDQEALNRLVAEKPSLARRILESIKSFLRKAVGLEDETLTQAQQLVNMLEKALLDSQENTTINGRNNDSRYSLTSDNTIASDDDGNALATELPGGTVALDTNTRYSLSSFNGQERDRVRQALYNAKNEDGTPRFTRQEVDKYLYDAMGLAAKIAQDRKRLDFEASDNQVFLKPNNDYHFTLDASTLCAKRLLYQGTFDYVQHALPDEVFTPEDLIDLVNIMNDMGFETPCGICYVESRRRWLDTYANEFLGNIQKNEDGFIDKFVDKRFKKASEEEKAALRERLAGAMPSIDDLTTSDGLEKLRKNDPLMYKAFVAAMNAKGSANPKVVQLRTEYRGDIGKLTAKDIQNVKDIGGLRIQSFSDFETPHLLDMVQAVLDMSAVGLTSQAYTKVPNFAWVFGDTGVKINLSLIGKGTGLDADGNLVFDNVEGMNFDEAMKLRNRYSKNVGTILVGINDNHIIAAMGDPRIDFIIPFHKSGWSAEELRKMPTLNNYLDYTDSQNELMIVGDRKHHVKEVKNMGMKALDTWIVKEGDKHPGYKVIDHGNGKYTVTYDTGYETESFDSHKKRTGNKFSNFEPVGAHAYWDFSKSGEENSRTYLKMCAEAGRIPKFSQFLVDNGDGTFSLPEGDDKRSTAIRTGYWKTLIDFKMYDNDGNGAPQAAVTPNINMNQAYRVLKEHKLGRKMPDRPNGTKGRFIPVESNNDVPVAIPAAEQYIELIRQKRGWPKPENPNDPMEAKPESGVIDVSTLGESQFRSRSYLNEPNTNAATAAMVNGGDAMLGNTESEYEEGPAEQQRAMAINPETGETEDSWKNSLPAAVDKAIDEMTATELMEYLDLDFGTTDSGEAEAEARTIMKNAVEDIKSEFDPTIYNGKLYVKPETMDFWLSGSGFAASNPNYAQAYITTMDPADFLRMTTTTEEGQRRILDEATPLNEEQLSENAERQPIQLLIDEEAGKVTGHEGRHRAVALARAGVTEMPVLLFDNATKYSKTSKDELTLSGQNPAFDDSVENGNELTFYNVIPLSTGNADEIRNRFVANAEDEANAAANGQRVLRYSLPAARPSDAPYMNAVDRGDVDTAQRMVSDEALKADVYTNKNNRPLKLYHGTKKGFGFTVFDTARAGWGLGAIWTTSNPSVARGYSDFGYDRTASSKYIPDDGTDETIIRNARNVLNSNVERLTEAKAEEIRQGEIGKYRALADMENEAMNNSPDYTPPSEIDWDFWGVVQAFNDILNEDQLLYDEDVDFRSEYRQRYNVQHDIIGRNLIEAQDQLKEYFNSNSEAMKELKESGKGYYNLLFRGYDHGDGIIDLEYNYKPLLDLSDKFIFTETGQVVKRNDLQNTIEMEEQRGSYTLYGIPGDNPLEIDAENSFWTAIKAPIIGEGYYSTDSIVKWAKANGYTSVVIRNVMDPGVVNAYGDDYVFFNSEQLKSADPVTYDDSGNVIPLSERFNTQQPDIRYSLPSNGLLDQKIRRYLGGKLTEGNNIPGEPTQSRDTEHRGEASGYLGGHTGYQARNGFVQFDNAPSQTIIDNLGRVGMQYNSVDRTWTSRNANVPLDDILNAIENGNRGITISAPRRANARRTQANGQTASEQGQTQQPTGEPGIFRPDEFSAPLEGMSPAMSTFGGPAQRQFGAGMLQNSDEVSRQARAYVLAQNGRTIDTNAEQVDRAIQWIRSNKQTPNSDGLYESLQRITSDNFDYRSADGQARMVAVMGMAVAKNDIMAQVALADAFNRQGTDLGRALQARKIFRLMTPEGRVSTLQKMLQNTQDELNAKGTNKELKFSDWIYRAAAAASEEGDFQKVQQAAARELAEQLPANWKEKMRAWRMLSMLGNPRTHIRNMVGNAVFMPAVGLKNKIGAGLEAAFIKDGERTKTLGLASKEARAFAKEDADTQESALRGESKYNDGNAIQQERKYFGQGKGILSRTVGQAVQAFSEFSSNKLEQEDWVFLKRHYQNALAGYMTANNLTAADMKGKTLEDARAYAISEAQKATYRDANAVATWLNEAGRKHPVAGFLVDAVLPFKKTPANILKRGIEYSPVGLINSLTRDAKHLKEYMAYQRGELNALPAKALSPTQFIDRLSSGLSGTAFLAFGALMSSLGAATVGFDDDDDEFDKLRGNQEYAINPGRALNRLFNINLFGEDVSYTVDWAAPMSMPFFVGAAIMDEIKKSANNKDKGIDIGHVLDSLLGISEPVFNLSMLDGVNSLFNVSQYAEGNAITQVGEKIITNYFTSFVPTFLGQAARTIDPVRRKSYVESGANLSTIRYALEGLENKIPWLSRTNIPYRNVWGEPDTSGQVEAALENFISPGYKTDVRDDPVVNELERLYHETGDPNMVPKAASKTVSINGEQVKLNAQQYDQYVVDRGKAARTSIEALMESPVWQVCDDSTRAMMIADAWTYANQIARNRLDPRGKKDNWVSAIEHNNNFVDAVTERAANSNRSDYIKGYGQSMAEALDSGDNETYQVALAALDSAGATDAEIRAPLRDYFKPLYKIAFDNNDTSTMEEIKDTLLETDIGFKAKDIDGWTSIDEVGEIDQRWLNQDLYYNR